MVKDIIVIRQPINDEEWKKVYDLRWKILKKPWKQPRGSEKDEKEEESFSFIALLDSDIIGTARFHKESENVGHIKYLVVVEEHRRKKVGRDLMNFVEWFARSKNSKYLEILARESSTEFFKELGYEIEEEGSLLFNQIPQFIMKKTLR